jgi:hypothetical protein
MNKGDPNVAIYTVVPAQAAYALRQLMKRVPTLAGHPLDHSEIQSSDAESRTAASG